MDRGIAVPHPHYRFFRSCTRSCASRVFQTLCLRFLCLRFLCLRATPFFCVKCFGDFLAKGNQVWENEKPCRKRFACHAGRTAGDLRTPLAGKPAAMGLFQDLWFHISASPIRNREQPPNLQNGRLGMGVRQLSASATILLLNLAAFFGGAGNDGTLAVAQDSSAEPHESARNRMVDDFVVAAGIKDGGVIGALRCTRRHEFIPARFARQSHSDMAVPIGYGQTISSPFIVGLMTESLAPKPTDRILEIGTGSGYQAAVISSLVQTVYSIEIVESLGRKAAATFKRLGYENIMTRIGDGYRGWPEHAPFDKIIVTCSPEEVPAPLVKQLKEGGLIVIPVGERYQQELILFRKRDGKLVEESRRPTLFVPMTGHAESNRRVLPNPARPKLVNGGFEKGPVKKTSFVDGWYYQRQLHWVTKADAPEGKSYVTFRNNEPGQIAHLLQGVPVNGRRVGHLDISAWVRSSDVVPGTGCHESAVIAVSFIDRYRKGIGSRKIGPFHGSTKWHQVSDSVRVPRDATEAIVRVGLLGATGELSFDAVELKHRPR